MELERKQRDRIRALIEATCTPTIQDDLLAHVEAVQMGEELLPAIRRHVMRGDWSKPGSKGKMAALTALMLAAHDIDNKAAKEMSSELVASQDVHGLYRARLDSINSVSLDDYHHLTYRSLPIYVCQSFGDPVGHRKLLERWLDNIPIEDLQGLSRLYVVPKKQDRFWGLYLRILARVVLVWRQKTLTRPLPRLATELTLYHEVGHHVFDEPGLSEVDHEILADTYALDRFRDAYPLLGYGRIGRMAVALAWGRAPKVYIDA